jgi:hypothetical protein
MSDESNSPNRPGNRPVPPRPAPPSDGPGLAPWEIGQTQNQQPAPPTGVQPQRPAPGAQGLAPWEIGQGQNQPPADNVYSQQSGARAPFPPNPQPDTYQQRGGYIQPGAYSTRTADNFQVREPSDIGRKIGIGALAVGVAFVGFMISYELIPTNVLPPSSYTKYVSGDGRFAIDQPAGWAADSNPVQPSSDATIGTAFFRNGSGKIQITSDTVSDLKASVLLNSAAALPPDFTTDPADAEHDFQKNVVASTMRSYVELPETTVATHFGPALVSEFTGVGGLAGLGGPMHGYRASASDGSNVFEVVLQCPEKSWTLMSPAFMRIIESIGPANGGTFVAPPSSGSPMPGIPAIPGASTPSQPPGSDDNPGAGGAAGVSTGQGDDAGP